MTNSSELQAIFYNLIHNRVEATKIPNNISLSDCLELSWKLVCTLVKISYSATFCLVEIFIYYIMYAAYFFDLVISHVGW